MNLIVIHIDMSIETIMLCSLLFLNIHSFASVKISDMFKSIALGVTASLFSLSSMAQFSAGADFALPNWDGASVGYGVSAGYELDAGDNLGVTGQAGYLIMGVDDAFFSNYAMIPIQLGAKYYLDEKSKGLYGHAQAGIHAISVTTPEIVIPGFGLIDDIVIPETTTSDSNVSFAVGAGYGVNESFDVSVRYNVITYDGGSNNYIGVRAGYTLGGSK